MRSGKDIGGLLLVIGIGSTGMAALTAGGALGLFSAKEQFNDHVQSTYVCAPTRTPGQFLVAEFQVASPYPLTPLSEKIVELRFRETASRHSAERLVKGGANVAINALTARLETNLKAPVRGRPIQLTRSCS